MPPAPEAITGAPLQRASDRPKNLGPVWTGELKSADPAPSLLGRRQSWIRRLGAGELSGNLNLSHLRLIYNKVQYVISSYG